MNSGSSYIIEYISQIILGNSWNPIFIPIIPPMIHAKLEYIIYFNDIWNLLYPNAFSVPISCLSSSTILVIDVSDTSAAIAKNTIGNTILKFAILSVSCIKLLYPEFWFLSNMYHSGFSIFDTSSLASINFPSASLILLLNSSLAVCNSASAS